MQLKSYLYVLPSLPHTGAAFVPGAHSMAAQLQTRPSTQMAPKEQGLEPHNAEEEEEGPEGKYTKENINSCDILREALNAVAFSPS